MVGGGNRRDEGSLVITSTNVFAALGNLKKKKKSEKVQGSSKSGRSDTVDKKSAKEPEPRVFWAPTPLTSKSWADVEDDDDDDYYETTAPLPPVWGAASRQPPKESSIPLEESESEEEEEEEEEEEHEEEGEGDEEEETEPSEPVVKKLPEAPPSQVVKEAERQLSKKELKKKGLEELDAVLAELGYAKIEEDTVIRAESTSGEGRKAENTNGDVKEASMAAGEGKAGKKKKKKEKAAAVAVKEPKDIQLVEVNSVDEPVGADIKERLKKVVATGKKKKPGKEMDAAARAATSEAALRSAKLAAAKKKEKNHYNQQPVR